MHHYSANNYLPDRAVIEAVRETGQRQEAINPYELFHRVRGPFHKAARRKKAALKAHESLDEGVRHVAFHIALSPEVSAEDAIKDLITHTSYQVVRDSSTHSAYITMIAPDHPTPDANKNIFCIVSYEEYAALAREICKTRLSAAELAVIGDNDDHFINHAARLAFLDNLRDFKHRDSIVGVDFADIRTVKHLIAAQSEASLGTASSATLMLTA